MSLKLFGSFVTTILRTVSFPSRCLDTRILSRLYWMRVSYTSWSTFNENADLCINFKLLHNKFYISIFFPHVTNIDFCIIVQDIIRYIFKLWHTFVRCTGSLVHNGSHRLLYGLDLIIKQSQVSVSTVPLNKRNAQ